MKVYISGKISGLPQGRVEKKFKDAENWLRNEGYTPVNPAGLQMQGLDYEDYMTIDLAMLGVCDAIYMLADWKDSPGAIREYNHAKTIPGMVFMFEEELLIKKKGSLEDNLKTEIREREIDADRLFNAGWDCCNRKSIASPNEIARMILSCTPRICQTLSAIRGMIEDGRLIVKE